MSFTPDHPRPQGGAPPRPGASVGPGGAVAVTLTSDSVQTTERIGQALGRALRTGHVVALIGPLGAGKTALVRGMAVGAGVDDPREVASPTFVIVNEYHARSATIHHIDAYRLRGSVDLEALGFDEMCETGAVVVEWADRVPELLPPDRLTVAIEPVSATGRRLHLTAAGPAAFRLIETLDVPC